MRERNHSHACVRGGERYGLHLTPDDIRLLADKVICGLAVEFERESRLIRKLFVQHGEIELPVVFNRRRGHIITILPPEAAEVRRALAKRASLTG